MMTTVKRFLVYLLLFHYTSGCVYNLEDPCGFYNVTLRDVSVNRLSYLQQHYNKTSRDPLRTVLWNNVENIAGPFQLSNAHHTTGTIPWNHEESGHDWGIKYSLCNGKHQSPINIRHKDVLQSTFPSLVFTNYTEIHPKMVMINNGHALDTSGPWGDHGTTNPTVRGGPLHGNYQLAAVHWHWGYDNSDGSEHAINSEKFPLEMHFVHFNTKYGSVANAVNTTDPEALAVISLLFNPDDESCIYSTKMVKTLVKARKGDVIYPAEFPLEIVKEVSPYFTYIGSLTSPPCYESVRWIVYENPFSIAVGDLDELRTFQVEGKPLVDNFRELQPLNGRTIHHHN